MSDYVGRFAPTPSGPLHLGSLVAALGSFLEARVQGGRWHLRMDDLDASRIMPGAESTIYRQLEAHGLTWDGPADRQTKHIEAYHQAIENLGKSGLSYACACTRAELRRGPRNHAGEPLYAGTCRARDLTRTGHALRVRVPDAMAVFDDAQLGRMACELTRDVGDFVIQRKDGIVAYQLACAVDESRMGITEVVRGADLVSSTFRQILLMDLLGLARPNYRHLPVLLDGSGRKLSKQNHAAALDPERAGDNLVRALGHLGHACPREAARWPAPDVIAFAIAQHRREDLGAEGK